MIEVAYVEDPGVIVSLHRSESGGWEREGRQLPWLGAVGHQHDGLSGFKVFAGDWMIGVYMLTGSALHRAAEVVLAYGAVVALLALLYFATAGCVAEPSNAPVATVGERCLPPMPSEAARRANCVCVRWGDERHPTAWRDRCVAANCRLGAPADFDPLTDDALARRTGR